MGNNQVSKPRDKSAAELPERNAPTKGDGLVTGIVSLLFIIGFYYLSYRYPLQINSSQTSPTYSDTPTWLQAGKYFLIAVVLTFGVVAGAIQWRHRAVVNIARSTFMNMAFLLLASFALAKGLVLGSVSTIIEGSLLALGFMLATFSTRWHIDADKLAKIVSAFIVVAVVVETVQVYLFLSQGRLPALAYSRSVTVRFGSILDDPNGFALLIAFLLPVVLVSWKNRIWQFVFSASLLTCLALAQSLTAITAVAVSFILGYFALNWRTPAAVIASCWGAPLLIFGAWNFISNSNVIAEVWSSKSASIDAHAGSLNVLAALKLQDWLGFGASTLSAESSYVNMIATLGIVFTGGYVCLGLVAIARLHRRIRQEKSSRKIALHYASYFYLIAYLIGSINMHFDGVFPINLLYVLGICFGVLGTGVEEHTAVTEPQRAAPNTSFEYPDVSDASYRASALSEWKPAVENFRA